MSTIGVLWCQVCKVWFEARNAAGNCPGCGAIGTPDGPKAGVVPQSQQGSFLEKPKILVRLCDCCGTAFNKEGKTVVAKDEYIVAEASQIVADLMADTNEEIGANLNDID
jgi:hypothetical protein